MAAWQIMLKGVPQVAPNSNPPATWFFDDAMPEQVGAGSVSTDVVRAYVAEQDALADGFNYVGQSPASLAQG
ncbi:hypothetical protein BRADO3632 [Bradyrhizobium sp. ORS 278]|uniref:hypothetical protein n=1 Tax=Bradyrhizobium sp. (strain ORS 278) TaxID=114615 RepID=UPI0001508E5C|nr:hypothetical protein [Bradyrhizobium sp. ORS 278]CAL77409.1 hypothetical protein BRADO3632 [Bradyrhizobium sp. ORS 278]